MALTPKDNEAFYREVDEELRRDQMRGFFGRFGILVIGAAVLFLAAVGGFLWWQNHTRSQAEKQAERFAAVLDEVEQGRTKSVDARIDQLAADGNLAYRTQALMLKAGLAMQAGKDAQALDIYRKIAADEDLPQIYRDAALIRQTALEYDKLQPAAVVARLKPLAMQGNPWFGSAGEMVGLAYMRQGKPQLAAPILVALAKDEKVPRTIRARASEVAASIGIDAGLQDGAVNTATKEANR